LSNNKDTKLVIIAHSTSEENTQIWYESIVENCFDQIEVFRDPEKKLYEQVGFNWNFNAGPMILMAMKVHYGGLFREMDKKSPGWDKRKMSAENDAEALKIDGQPTVPGPKFSDKMGQDFLMRRPLEGENPCQQGGDVVLDAEGKILKVYHMNSVNDRVTMEELGL